METCGIPSLAGGESVEISRWTCGQEQESRGNFSFLDSGNVSPPSPPTLNFWRHCTPFPLGKTSCLSFIVKVTQSCSTLCDPMDYTVHGILQARILEWVAFPFSRGSSQPRDRTQVSHIAGRFFTSWATREARYFSFFLHSVLVLSLPPLLHQLQDPFSWRCKWVD